MKGFKFVIACGWGTVLCVWRWGWGEEICACSTAHQRSGKVIFFLRVCVCVLCAPHGFPACGRANDSEDAGRMTCTVFDPSVQQLLTYRWSWAHCCFVLMMRSDICLSCTWHYSYTLIVNDTFIFYFFSLQLCVFSIWRSSPGPLCSCYYPPLTPRGPGELFSLGYTDKLPLPNWLLFQWLEEATMHKQWLFFFPLSLHVCLHIHTRWNTQTNNMTSSYKTMNLRWVQHEEKATNPA